MPIYAYRCSACGRAKDVLQKMSDPVLTDCPFCGEPTFVKQVTAAGFQLKGSGWYVTDFRGDSKAPKTAEGGVAPEAAKADARPVEGKGGDGKTGGDSSSGTSAAAPAKGDSGGGAAAAPAPSPPSPATGGSTGPTSK